MIDQLDPLWCAWFSGLVDGEGCFTLQNDKNLWRVRFIIGLREDDVHILREIYTHLRCGLICQSSNESVRNKGGKGRDAYKYIVGQKGEIVQIIVPLLDQYPLRTRKKHQYHIWREAAIVLSESKRSYENTVHLTMLKKQFQKLASS